MEALPRHPEHALPWRAFGLGCAAIVVLLCIAYAPVTRAGFIWDDDSYVTKNANVQSPDGVFRFWIPRETPQFYPLVFSSFWVEFQLWGLDPLGYHIVNVVLHGINAILLWLILIRLRIPGAFVVAALFAVHPIHVESVAWITERKNVLSGMFYLLGMLSYLRFEENLTSEPRRSAGGWYGLAFVAYVAALLSKTITCSLPAALLLIMFWQRRPLNTARIMRIMPFFLIGIPLALITVWLERDHVGASGVDFDQSFLERCAIASRSLLFYAGKIAVPYELAFFYHRWTIQGINLVSGLAMLTVLSVAITSIVATKRGWRAPFVLLALFAGTAFPALGFFNVYPHRFSWVADHFIYLASVAVLVMIIASLASIPTLRSRLGAVLAGIVLLVAAILSHQHTKTFESLDTLWLTTIERTPSSWMPNNNMSSLMLRRAGVAMDAGDTDLKHAFAREARDFALRAIELKPDHANAHSNAAEAFRLIDDVGTALYHQQTAIDLLEARADVDRRHKELADEYFKRGRLEHLQKRWDDTETSFRRAVDLHPEHMMYWQELAQFYERQDRLDDAIIVYGTMLDLEPEFAPIIARLARLLLEQVRYDESIALLERSLESTDDELLRCQFLDMLANIHASAGSFEIAIRLATEARDIAIRLDVPILRDGIPSRLESYQNSLDARRNGAGPPTPSR